MAQPSMPSALVSLGAGRGTGDSGLGVFALVCTTILALAYAAAVLATRTGNRL